MAGDGDARLEAVRRLTKAAITHPGRVLHPDRVLYPDAVEYCLGIAPARYAAGT
jgi:hypothetical protein